MVILIDKLITDNPHVATKHFLFENSSYSSTDESIDSGISNIPTRIKIDKMLDKDKIYWLLPIAVLENGEEITLPMIPVSLLSSINGDGKLYISSLSDIVYVDTDNAVRGKLKLRNMPRGNFDIVVSIITISPEGEKIVSSTQNTLLIDVDIGSNTIPRYLTYYLVDKNDNSTSEVFRVNISVDRRYTTYTLNDTEWLSDIDTSKELVVYDVHGNVCFSGLMADFDYTEYIFISETYFVTYTTNADELVYLTVEVKDITQFDSDRYEYNKTLVSSEIYTDFLDTNELTSKLLVSYVENVNKGWFISTGIDKAISIYKTDSWKIENWRISEKRNLVTANNISVLSDIDFDNVKYIKRYFNNLYIQEGNVVKRYNYMSNELTIVNVNGISDGTIAIPLSDNTFILLGNRSVVEAYIVDSNETLFIGNNPVDKQVTLEYLVYHIHDNILDIAGYDGSNIIVIQQTF